MGNEDEFSQASQPSPEDNAPDADYTEAAAEFFSQTDQGDSIDTDSAKQKLEKHGVSLSSDGDPDGSEDDDSTVIDLDAWRQRKK